MEPGKQRLGEARARPGHAQTARYSVDQAEDTEISLMRLEVLEEGRKEGRGQPEWTRGQGDTRRGGNQEREEKRGKEDEWGAAKTRVCHALPMAYSCMCSCGT